MIERAVLEPLYVEKQMSSPMIAEKLGVSPSTVCRALREYGLVRHVERPGASELLNDITTLGRVATAEKYGVSRSAVANWIREYRASGLFPKRIFYTYRRQRAVKTPTEKFSTPPPPATDLIEYMADHSFAETAAKWNVSVVTVWRWTRYYRNRGEMP